MINLQLVTQFMYENFERVTTSATGTHFHARCLLCGDSKKSLSKKRFHLDWKDGEPVWQCFNCERSGGFLRLFCEVKGLSLAQAIEILYRYDPSRLKKTLSARPPSSETHKIEQSETNYNWILDDCVSESTQENFSAVAPTWLKILKDFRVDRQIPENIKFYYAYQGRYKDRIIIPIFKDKDIIYFQARRIPGTDVDPKYKNPPSQKSLVIFNENVFRNDKFIIVAEGLIDAFTVGNQGTTCLGKSISEEFLDRLFGMTNKGIIIVFDNDEPGKESLLKFMFGDKYTPANKYCQRVKYFLMPKKLKECKDINIVSKYEIGDVYDFVVSNSYNFAKAFVSFKLEV